MHGWAGQAGANSLGWGAQQPHPQQQGGWADQQASAQQQQEAQIAMQLMQALTGLTGLQQPQQPPTPAHPAAPFYAAPAVPAHGHEVPTQPQPPLPTEPNIDSAQAAWARDAAWQAWQHDLQQQQFQPPPYPAQEAPQAAWAQEAPPLPSEPPPPAQPSSHWPPHDLSPASSLLPSSFPTGPPQPAHTLGQQPPLAYHPDQQSYQQGTYHQNQQHGADFPPHIQHQFPQQQQMQHQQFMAQQQQQEQEQRQQFLAQQQQEQQQKFMAQQQFMVQQQQQQQYMAQQQQQQQFMAQQQQQQQFMAQQQQQQQQFMAQQQQHYMPPGAYDHAHATAAPFSNPLQGDFTATGLPGAGTSSVASSAPTGSIVARVKQSLGPTMGVGVMAAVKQSMESAAAARHMGLEAAMRQGMEAVAMRQSLTAEAARQSKEAEAPRQQSLADGRQQGGQGGVNRHQSVEAAAAVKQSLEALRTAVDAASLLRPPGRCARPVRVLLVLRGLPGSGKSYLARRIREIELEEGGEAPRLHALDDYFMAETEREVEEEGPKGRPRKRKVTENVYLYDPEMEAAYRRSLVKSICKTLDESRYALVIMDAPNIRLDEFRDVVATAQRARYATYALQPLDSDPAACARRNVHGRTLIECEAMAYSWEPAPAALSELDARGLLQGKLQDAGHIEEVDMDDEGGTKPEGGSSGANAVEEAAPELLAAFTSRWATSPDDRNGEEASGSGTQRARKKSRGLGPIALDSLGSGSLDDSAILDGLDEALLAAPTSTIGSGSATPVAGGNGSAAGSQAGGCSGARQSALKKISSIGNKPATNGLVQVLLARASTKSKRVQWQDGQAAEEGAGQPGLNKQLCEVFLLEGLGPMQGDTAIQYMDASSPFLVSGGSLGFEDQVHAEHRMEHEALAHLQTEGPVSPVGAEEEDGAV